MEYLFIYGTLAPGKPNEHILKKIKGSWQKASVWGSLHEEGWGAKLGCPGIKLSKKTEKIKGLIFSSNGLEKKWQELDDFEGKEYQRVLTQAILEDGIVLDVYIYALKE